MSMGEETQPHQDAHHLTTILPPPASLITALSQPHTPFCLQHHGLKSLDSLDDLADTRFRTMNV